MNSNLDSVINKIEYKNEINKKVLLYEIINKNNILDILDYVIYKYINVENPKYIFRLHNGNNIDYIVDNIISLKYESNNQENIFFAEKINNFLINNIDNFKKLDEEIILESPYFENQIEERRQKENINELDNFPDAQEICPKCGSDKIKHLGDKQIRSADEGMTSFFVCNNNNCSYYIKKEERYQFRR